MQVSLSQFTSQLNSTFNISRGAKTEIHTIVAELEQDGIRGRGECVPYQRYGETLASTRAAIEAVTADIEAGISREQLQTLMPAGAARCAVDCALWDLEAKRAGKPVWQLAGLPKPRPVQTAITISLDTPEAMAIEAAKAKGALLKLKLGGNGDIARLEAVHAARPDACLIVDGNEGVAPDSFEAFCTRAAGLGVVLIEQPFPAGDDAPLRNLKPAIPICADESVHTAADIAALADRYQAVNIKLDKTGGLTGAIAMLKAARAANIDVMIGCMVAGSLSMAPALLLAGLADYTDLDGPLWLAEDIANGLHYENGYVSPPGSELWG